MRFTIPGEPVAKERPRRGPAGNWYTPPKTRAYEELIGYAARAAMHSKIEGPVVLSLTIYTNNHKLDTDNVLKAISDGLNGHAYNDDRQICETHLYRIWSENPRVVVEIEETEAETEHPTAA